MTRAMILDIATRIEVPKRGGAERQYRSPVRSLVCEGIVAVAMLEFEVDQEGFCSNFSLESMDRRMAGESAVVVKAERKLAALLKNEGALIMHHGRRDLAALRLAALRHFHFSIGGAVNWLIDDQGGYFDLVTMLASGTGEEDEFRDLVARFGGGLKSPQTLPVGPVRRERVTAEVNVVQAMMVYLHLLAEIRRSFQPLSHGMMALTDFISSRSSSSPHLIQLLETEVFKTFDTIPF